VSALAENHQTGLAPSARPVDSGILQLLVFVAGLVTMGAEMCASRLLAPYFGSSLPVWGLLIGLLLAYLAVGSALGGRIADRRPEQVLVYQLAGWAGFWIGCVPYVAHPILRLASGGLATTATEPLVGAFAGVLALFSLPMVLLGCVSPFVMRLSLKAIDTGGNVAGRLSALSTLGSLLGTFGTVFALIPLLGTRRSMAVLALVIVIVSATGLRRACSRWAPLFIGLCLVLVVRMLLPSPPIKSSPGLLYERDSSYNYVQVLQDGDQVVLKLNEGEGIQSVYEPDRVITGYVYDYFLLVPFFRSELWAPPLSSLCLLGLAGGTSARQFSQVFGPIPIDGVEIDPAVVEAGRRFLSLDLPNLDAITADGRAYLAHTTKQYDVVLVDAYSPPYIPFHLTTVEFFRLVHDHQTSDGVLGINVAHLQSDTALVTAVANTVASVYPSVYVVSTQGGQNSVVIASCQPSEWTAIEARLAHSDDTVISDVASRAAGRIRRFIPMAGSVLTDDHAPVERMVHAMIAHYVFDPAVPEVNP